jgi:hypothetical protein
VRVFSFKKMCQTEHSQDHDVDDAGECATRSSNLYGDLVSG